MVRSDGGQDGGLEKMAYKGPAAWTAEELRGSPDWLYELTSNDIEELLGASHESRSIPLVEVRKDHFKLEQLGEVLLAIRQEVVWGRGFKLVRGLPVEELDLADVARIYIGLGAWMGDAVPQNAAGHLLGHVKDIGQDPHNPEHRVYATNYRHLFHTDSCDVVGLLCVHPAKSGGQSAIASSTSIYNRLVSVTPHLAHVLSEPFVVDRKGEIPPGKGPTYNLAVFHPADNYVTTVYARDFIEAAQRFDSVPRLSDLQLEALDTLDDLAASDEFRLDMDFQVGDIQWLHNHQILHARTSYVDFEEPERKRHLLRLWLSIRDGRELPQALAERYGSVERGHIRGGIRVAGQVMQAPLQAE